MPVQAFADQIRVFSYGGGIQSTAAMVLSAQGKINYSRFLFSNVGDDSEYPDTIRYVHEVAAAFAEQNGLILEELRHTMRDGTDETLWKKLTREGSRSVGIPVRLEGSGAPGRRSCTMDFKVRRISKRLRALGATEHVPAVVGIGISLDEFHRMKSSSNQPLQILEYPLIDLRLTRQDCINIIVAAGLPVPPKSSCWFCPFKRTRDWQELQRNRPDLFDKAIALETVLSDRSQMLGRGRVFLSARMQPLAQAIGGQATFDFDSPEEGDSCETGYCLT